MAEELSLISQLKRDDVYQRIKNLYITAKKAVNVEEIQTELSSLHSSRTSRSLRSSSVSAKTVSKAQSIDIANRARLVEIRSTCSRSKFMIEQAVATARSHLRANYTVELKERYGNSVAEINAGIDLMLGRFITFESEITDLVASIDMYIKDIDQAGYGIRNLVDILKLVLNNNANVDVL